MQVRSNINVENLEVNIMTQFGEYKPFRYVIYPVSAYTNRVQAQKVLNKKTIEDLESDEISLDNKMAIIDNVLEYTRPLSGSPILYKAVYMNDVVFEDRVALAKEIVNKSLKAEG